MRNGRSDIIWSLDVPVGNDFASLLVHYQKLNGKRCAACGLLQTPQHPPLTIEWEDGNDVIGDFTSAGSKIVVREAIVDEILEHFHGIRKGRVDFFDHPNLYRPETSTKKSPRRIWLPYSGPSLCEIVIEKEVDLDHRSTVILEKECEKCGARLYKRFDGVEVHNSREHIQRSPGHGLFIKKESVEGFGFFRPRFTGLALCTDQVRQFIQARAFSNIVFLEYGNLV